MAPSLDLGAQEGNRLGKIFAQTHVGPKREMGPSRAMDCGMWGLKEKRHFNRW